MRALLLLAFALFFAAPSINAQKILLKIASITPTAGEEVKAVDFKTDASTNWVSGGGASVGKPNVKEFLIKKELGQSTNELQRRLFLGLATPAVVIEYYDNQNKLYFSITMRQVFLTSFYWLSPECPTCVKLEHQVGFIAKQYETFDVATGITFKFDVATGSTY